jgi:hypothetical protein
MGGKRASSSLGESAEALDRMRQEMIQEATRKRQKAGEHARLQADISEAVLLKSAMQVAKLGIETEERTDDLDAAFHDHWENQIRKYNGLLERITATSKRLEVSLPEILQPEDNTQILQAYAYVTVFNSTQATQDLIYVKETNLDGLWTEECCFSENVVCIPKNIRLKWLGDDVCLDHDVARIWQQDSKLLSENRITVDDYEQRFRARCLKRYEQPAMKAKNGEITSSETLS